MKQMKLAQKNGQFYIRRRVPSRYEAVEPRRIVNICLFTDSKTIADQKAGQVWAELIEGWEAKLSGRGIEGEERLEAARSLAHRRGFRYLDSNEVAKLPLPELMARMNAIKTKRGDIDKSLADAVLGLPKRSSVKVSAALEAYYEVSGDRMLGKNENQIKRHKSPRLAATKNFLSVIPDKPLADITTEDMFEFRKWLVERVERGEVLPGSANKDVIHLLSMWKPVAQSKGFKLQFEASGLLLKASKKSKKRSRIPFSEDWIAKKLLADGALKGLNTEARLIVLGMVNTGYRPSEGAGILPEEINLEANVPHITIQPNRIRSLKNEESERVIPLTGVSLEAFRQARGGFQRYAGKNDNLSAVVNKFMREHDLRETPQHTLYCLRHSMEDRMLRAGIDERIRMDILGHQIKRERYGEGGGLQHVYDLLMPIAH